VPTLLPCSLASCISIPPTRGYDADILRITKMNPEDSKPAASGGSGDIIGHVPRKKKLLPSAAADAPHGSVDRQRAAPTAATEVAIPRKIKLSMGAAAAAAASGGLQGGGGRLTKGKESPRPMGSPLSSSSYARSALLNDKRRRSNAGQDDEDTASFATRGTVAQNSRVQIISESPFVIRIDIKGMKALARSTAGTVGSSATPTLDGDGRSPRKRSKPKVASIYQDLVDTDDSDDYLTEAEEKELLKKRQKRLKKAAVSGDAGTAVGSTGIDPSVVSQANTELTMSDGCSNMTIEAPPPGELSSLWYSKECFLHVFVAEKICGWKTRPVVRLVEDKVDAAVPSAEAKTDSVGLRLPLDLAEATRLQQKALTMSGLRTDPKRRMEISRINPIQCPAVMYVAANESNKPLDANSTPKRYKVEGSSAQSGGPEREEVLLVKWRGRSYLHCSWERVADIESFDPSTNNSAKNKVRRFYQQQEAVYGLNWKQVVEEDRNTAASIHIHTSTDAAGGASAAATTPPEPLDQVDEYFSPQCLEVERILACDESEMDMHVFAKQRAINMRYEPVDLTDGNEQELPRAAADNAEQWNDVEEPWDIEDNVRYVVKWKGSPYVDMTWEYWWDIKRDAVDQVEDFWYRQQAPDVEAMRRSANRPHPLMKDFKKLQESPSYGVSKKPRPVDGAGTSEPDSDPGFRLRSYQLEGVNWLLFNWWNRRSCILADEMGLGKVSCLSC
jgi:Chromo (CHRromatin Organisation MOdifier) domain